MQRRAGGARTLLGTLLQERGVQRVALLLRQEGGRGLALRRDAWLAHIGAGGLRGKGG